MDTNGESKNVYKILVFFMIIRVISIEKSKGVSNQFLLQFRESLSRPLDYEYNYGIASFNTASQYLLHGQRIFRTNVKS